MKKILILIISLSLFSCQKEFVEKLPTTSQVVDNFYKTPEDATQALTAVYNMLTRDDYWSSHIISEVASDDCAGGVGTGDGAGFQQMDRGLQQITSSVYETIWSTYYGLVYRANIYLENEAKINWKGSEPLQAQYRAEARFLRGYAHFYMARIFGEIPYLDHVLSADEQPGRTPAIKLYQAIMDDFKYCADNGLSVPYAGMTTENWNRATKWAAEAMMARVYLYYTGYYNQPDLNSYNDAGIRAILDDFIANGGFGLADKYASLWRVPCVSELDTIANYAGEKNNEVVWSIGAKANSGNYGANRMSRMIGPRGTDILPYGHGWGAMTVLPSLWNAYDTSDTRRKATILNWDAEGIRYDYGTQAQAQYTGYNCKKYELLAVKSATGAVGPEDQVYGDWQWDGEEDYMVIRYADVLLMAAELYVNADNGNATKYVNLVRDRAFNHDGLHNYGSVTLADIMNERRLELACEGIRYWDILRSCKGDFTKLVGILTYVDTTDNGDYSQSATNVNSLDVDGNNFVDKKGLFQLPKQELDLMGGKIQQNPGYN